MTNRTVLISGGGIAGPALAFWLAAAGFRPTLIEQAPQLRAGGYVIDFWGHGYWIAERMGLAADINRVGYHVREMRIVNDSGKRVAGFGTDVFGELTNDRYVTLARSDLARLLFEKIKDTTEIIFGDEIVGFEERSDGVRVRLKHGAEREFDLVIGADGLHSGVRRLAFGPRHQFEKKLGYAVAAFEVEDYRPRDEDVYLMYGQPGRMVGRFTLHHNRTLFLFVYAVDSGSLPKALGTQKQMLREKYEDGGWECAHILEELDRTDGLYFDSVSQIRMNRWSQGRIALAGDAAFCVSLLAGQGSALAIISAYVLAGELLEADGRHQEGFLNYEAFLREYIQKKQRGAKRFAAALAPRTQLGLLIRNLVTKAFAVPGLARAVIGKEITDEIQLPDYRWPFLDS
ncbi:FAD-binding domain [Mesorhizobium sp. BH1-1-5]|uniref:FAD-binding domain n=1 Tax=Mesorhizobium sp. BH1-1-5 TaxID=2876661 RepID=UPI001CCCF3A0|nr:FAD-binding domain [Mesorhizobium sp. BH1-1-5]MBZ9987657.1 FAD-binding domain [Mesorhizobium sp. BH1-1-5]